MRKLRSINTKKLIKAVFSALIILGLLSGILRALFFPRDINSYESREACKLTALTPGSFADSSFQDGMEKALADQTPMAQYFKKFYNLLKYRYQQLFLLPLADSHSDRYFRYEGLNFIDGCVVYEPVTPAETDPRTEALARQRNAAIAENPETDFYMYYMESDYDLNFETGEKTGLYEYFGSLLDIPSEHTARLEINSIDDFQRWYYRTDHHWNCDGAYKGYLDILELLGCEDEPLVPTGRGETDMTWAGSKAVEVGFREYEESFAAYSFDFPEMSIKLNCADIEDCIMQGPYFAGEMESISYSGYYGGLAGELSFSTGRPERENLLILGDSFDNAIVKLLAAHYNNTYSVDTRIYEADIGQAFDLTEYIARNDIDKVLYNGFYVVFAGEEFLDAELTNGIQ